EASATWKPPVVSAGGAPSAPGRFGGGGLGRAPDGSATGAGSTACTGSGACWRGGAFGSAFAPAGRGLGPHPGRAGSPGRANALIAGCDGSGPSTFSRFAALRGTPPLSATLSTPSLMSAAIFL